MKFDNVVTLPVLSYFIVIFSKHWHNWCHPWRKYVHNWRNVFNYLAEKEMLSFKYKLRMSGKPSCALQPNCLFHKVNFPPLHSSVPVVCSTFFSCYPAVPSPGSFQTTQRLLARRRRQGWVHPRTTQWLVACQRPTVLLSYVARAQAKFDNGLLPTNWSCRYIDAKMYIRVHISDSHSAVAENCSLMEFVRRVDW
jgi:hypothetical protein